MSTMTTTLFDVPELVEMLASLLEPKDLVACLQVCSTWHSAFAPIIWRNFDDSTGMWNKEILRKSSQGRNQAWVNSVFSRYGHLIRHGTFSWFGTMRAARDHCHGLVSLDLQPGSRITEVQADSIHDHLREAQRLQHLESERKRLKMEAARAKYVADGHLPYTFQWDYLKEEVVEVPLPAQNLFATQFTSAVVGTVTAPVVGSGFGATTGGGHTLGQALAELPTALTSLSEAMPANQVNEIEQNEVEQENEDEELSIAEDILPVPTNPFPVTSTALPVPEYYKTEIWNPISGEVDAQEIQACIDLLRTNPGLQKLVTIRLDEASEELQQSLENALSSMVHLIEAKISLNASQIAQLSDLLPKVEILNVAKQPTVNYGYGSFSKSKEPAKKPLVDREMKMDKTHPFLRSLVLGDRLTFIGQMGALLDHCPRLEKLSVSSFAFSTLESISENVSAPASQGPIFGAFAFAHAMPTESAAAQQQRSPPKPDRPIFTNAFKKHMALKDLEISATSNADGLGALLERLPRLENLKFLGKQAFVTGGDYFDIGQYFITRPNNELKLSHPVHQHLRSLSVHTSLDMRHFIQDVRQCSKLEALIIGSCMLEASTLETATNAQSIAEDEESRLSSLRSLVVDLGVKQVYNSNINNSSAPTVETDINLNADKALAALLELMPNLESFKSETLGPLAAHAMSKYCNAHLKVVDLDKAYLVNLERVMFYPGSGLGSEVASRLLSSCPNLETFLGLYYTIHAEQIAQYPWVCRNLKKLRTQIVGVPRLNQDQHDKVKDRLSGGVALPEPNVEEQAILDQHERCRKLQRTVFDQLSRMTELTHLDLGYENRNPWEYKAGESYEDEEDGEVYLLYADPFPDTLELTLEAGFGQLVTLQKLEMFGFESVDHRMQMQECQWMAENWPNLKLMYGLAKTLLYEDKPDRHGNAMRAWMETARPDLVHSTLFSDDI